MILLLLNIYSYEYRYITIRYIIYIYMLQQYIQKISTYIMFIYIMTIYIYILIKINIMYIYTYYEYLFLYICIYIYHFYIIFISYIYIRKRYPMNKSWQNIEKHITLGGISLFNGAVWGDDFLNSPRSARVGMSAAGLPGTPCLGTAGRDHWSQVDGEFYSLWAGIQISYIS